jgi:hypothetical protein
MAMDVNKNKKAILSLTALTLTAVLLASTTYAAISTSQTLNSSGSITVSANLGVYSDSACTNSISSFSWGSLTPGASTTKTVYIKNTGSGVSLTLNMTSLNWNPTSANGPITVTWNKEGTTLAPGQSTQATLTLTVSSSIVDITDFSVQISIKGTS